MFQGLWLLMSQGLGLNVEDVRIKLMGLNFMLQPVYCLVLWTECSWFRVQVWVEGLWLQVNVGRVTVSDPGSRVRALV